MEGKVPDRSSSHNSLRTHKHSVTREMYIEVIYVVVSDTVVVACFYFLNTKSDDETQYPVPRQERTSRRMKHFPMS